MSFCFLYNVVSENYSVQNSPWGGGGGGGEGGLLPAQGLYDVYQKLFQEMCYAFQDAINLILFFFSSPHCKQQENSTGLGQ